MKTGNTLVPNRALHIWRSELNPRQQTPNQSTNRPKSTSVSQQSSNRPVKIIHPQITDDPDEFDSKEEVVMVNDSDGLFSHEYVSFYYYLHIFGFKIFRL